MTDCTACGDCCDPVELSMATWERIGAIARKPGDPETDGLFYDAIFTRQHWHPVWQSTMHIALKCDYFNDTTRRCEAYDQRPNVCAGYPYYGEKVLSDGHAQALPARCAFNADVRRTLPILEVR